MAFVNAAARNVRGGSIPPGKRATARGMLNPTRAAVQATINPREQHAWQPHEHERGAAPSRESLACSSVSGTVISSSRVTRRRVQSALLRSSACSAPRRPATYAAAVQSVDCVGTCGVLAWRRARTAAMVRTRKRARRAPDTAARSTRSRRSHGRPHCSRNSVAAGAAPLPTCASHPAARPTPAPTEVIAPRVLRNSAASSTPSMAMQPDWLRRENVSIGASTCICARSSGVRPAIS